MWENNEPTPRARVRLHGRLATKFGKEFNLGATTPARAIGSLIILKPGFREELAKGQYRIIRGPLKNGMPLSEQGLHLRLPPNGEFHIVPAAKGAGGGSGGVGKMIIGAALIAVAIWTMQPEIAVLDELGATVGAVAGTGGLGATAFGGLVTAGQLAFAGGALFLAGAMSVIAPQQKLLGPNDPLNRNWTLTGQMNVNTQGAVIPVVVGDTMTGSVVISVGYSADEHVVASGSVTVGTTLDTSPGTSGVDYGQSGSFFAPDGSYGAGSGKPRALPPTDRVLQGSTPPFEDGPSGAFGSKGGKGGKGSGGTGGTGSVPYVAANTLHSNATVRIIDLLSAGEIEGFSDATEGAKCIYFDGTPLISPDGHVNFHGVSWQLRTGTPDQDPVSGFPASEESHAVNVQVKESIPVTRFFTSTTANAVRITMQIPQMFKTDKDTGDVNPAPTLEYFITIQPSKGASGGDPGWTMPPITVLQDAIYGGKTMSPYERSYRIDLPGRDMGADSWSVVFYRITADNLDYTGVVPDPLLANDLYWAYFDIITDHQMMYSNCAYIALTIDARAFNQSLPARTYRIKGVRVPVPANYDPVARSYASSGPGTTGGTWDLVSMKTVWTQNPAWHYLNLISHPLYGGRLKDAYLEATKADLYVIAQYCDGSVPDGYGGYETRYEANAVIAAQDDAYRMLQTVASAFRGMGYWGAGQVRVTADMPKTPVTLINQANVEDGMINYEATSSKTRFNYATVTFRDRSMLFALTPEAVPGEATDIARRGLVTTDLAAWGVTSRGRAHRMGRWAIYTSTRQTETVTFKAGMAQLGLRPGDVFEQLDPSIAGLRNGGRLGRGTVTRQSATNLFPSTKSGAPSHAAGATVNVSTDVAPFFPGCSVFKHIESSGASDNNSGYCATGAGGTATSIWLSCYVWVPAAFAGSGALDVEGTGWTGGYVSLDLTKRDQWQRLSVLASGASGAVSVAAVLRLSVTSAQTVYTTGWMANADAALGDFVPTVGTAADTSIIYLDALLPSIPSPSGSTLSVLLSDGSVDLDVPISSFATSHDGTATVVLLSRNLLGLPMPAQEWILKTSSLQPKLYQVVAITEPSKGQFAVSAIDYDPTKFAAIENGLDFGTFTYSDLPALILAALPPPTAVQVTPYITGIGASTTLRVTVSWTAPNDPRIVNYQVRLVTSSQAKIMDVVGVSTDIDNLPPDTYQISVRSAGANSRTSIWTLAVSTSVIDGVAPAPAVPLGLTAVGGTRQVQIHWTAVPRRDIGYYEVWRAPDASGVAGSWSQLGSVAATTYLDADSDVLYPNTVWWYKIRAVTNTGSIGTFTSAVSARTTLLIVDDLADGIINTAKFASSIKAPYLITSTAASGHALNDLAFDQTTLKLYKWVNVGGTNQWVPVVNTADMAGTVSITQLASNIKAPYVISDTTVAGTAVNDYAVSTADHKLYRWTGSAWVAVVNAADMTGQLTDAQIASLTFAKATDRITTTMITDSAISTAKLAAGSVSTAKLAAGAVTTSNLAVGSATNLCWNPCLEATTDGWNYSIYGYTGTGHFQAAKVNYATWAISGEGSGVIWTDTALGTGGGMDVAWDPNSADGVLGIPCSPGDVFEVQAKVMPHRCASFVWLGFVDSSNTYISSAVGNRVVIASPAEGGTLSSYRLSWIVATAPAGASRVRGFVRGFDDGGTDIATRAPNTYLFFTEFSIGKGVANATEASPWSPGGVSTISGGMIKTRSLQANSLVADSITAAEIAAGAISTSELAANAVTAAKIAANTITAGQIAADTITAGQIAASAIGTSELAAGSIRSTHLASDFALISSAQIGTATIQTANIQDLTVNGSKINGSAASGVGVAYDRTQWNYPGNRPPSSYGQWAYWYRCPVSVNIPNGTTNVIIWVNLSMGIVGTVAATPPATGTVTPPSYGSGGEAGGF